MAGSEQNQSPLWHNYHMGAADPDPGGGILYALRYTQDHLDTQRDLVINVLTDAGSTIQVLDERLVHVDLSAAPEEDHPKLFVMLEELGVLNKALEHKQVGIEQGTVEELAHNILDDVEVALDRADEDTIKLQAMYVLQIVQELTTAHEQNQVLSVRDREAVASLFVGLFDTGLKMLARENILNGSASSPELN
ncbi:MAG: hypothetical protein AAB436_02110 [Patescibacteria group bacterium]